MMIATMTQALELAKTARLSELVQDHYIQLDTEYSIKIAPRALVNGTDGLCATLVYEGKGLEMPRPTLRCAASEPADVRGYGSPFIEADEALQGLLEDARARIEYLAELSQALGRTLDFSRGLKSQGH